MAHATVARSGPRSGAPRLVHGPRRGQVALCQLIVDQLCEATGGPCYYIGRPTRTAHAGLHISEPEWQTTVMHLTATLDKFNVPAREKKDLFDLLTKLKGDVVEN